MAQGRRALVTKLLDLSRQAEPILLQIEEAKEALRAEISETGEGFTEVVDGLGTVEGKAGCERRLRGILPVLEADAFLDLPQARRQKLMDDGVVVEEGQYQPARKPSVTVRL